MANYSTPCHITTQKSIESSPYIKMYIYESHIQRKSDVHYNNYRPRLLRREKSLNLLIRVSNF